MTISNEQAQDLRFNRSMNQEQELKRVKECPLYKLIEDPHNLRDLRNLTRNNGNNKSSIG